jgi:hypothetical protein
MRRAIRRTRREPPVLPAIRISPPLMDIIMITTAIAPSFSASPAAICPADFQISACERKIAYYMWAPGKTNDLK